MNKFQIMLLSRENIPPIPAVPKLNTQILEILKSGQGSLDMGDWHTCKTTHCIGGWIVMIAGEAGEKLEKACGTEQAAALIFEASCPRMEMPNWFASGRRALQDLAARAAKE